MLAIGRRARRAEFGGEVWLTLEDRQVRARAKDISKLGMLIFPESFLWQGAKVRVAFWLPDGREKIVRLQGTLVRHGDEGGYSWAVKFLQVPEEISERLDSFVRARTKGPPPIPLRRPNLAHKEMPGLYEETDETTVEIHHASLAELCRHAGLSRMLN